MQCKSARFPITYLGLPLSDKRLTKTDFLPLLEKFQKALAGWRASLLSVGGRLVLVNSVLSALPQYYMSIFLLPKWLLCKMDQIRKRFLWHGHKDHQTQIRALYMVNWDLVTRPKDQGGLGVRNLQFVNCALLMRWMWQWIADRHAWWKQATPLSPQSEKPWTAHNGSAFWKSFKCLQSAFDSSVQYNVGTGDTISFWHDNWYGSPMKYIYPNLFHLTQHKQISVSQCRQSHEWHMQLTSLPQLAQAEKDHLLQSLQQFHILQTEDNIRWLRHTDTFTVNSAYQFLSHRPSPTSQIANIWRLKAPPRVLIFAWLLLNNRLPTIDNLAKRGWHLPNMCQMCKAQQETVSHLFQKCPFAVQIRSYIYTVFGTSSVSQNYCTPVSNNILMDLTEHEKARHWELTTCFVLWRERCRRIFVDTELQPMFIVREIKQEWDAWFQ